MPMTEGGERTDQVAVRTLVRLPRLRSDPETELPKSQLRFVRETGWEPRNAQGPTRRRTEVLTYLSGLVGILVM